MSYNFIKRNVFIKRSVIIDFLNQMFIEFVKRISFDLIWRQCWNAELAIISCSSNSMSLWYIAK